MKKLILPFLLLFSYTVNCQFLTFEQISHPLKLDSRIVELNNNALFATELWPGGGELWKSDGTLNGTMAITPATDMIVRYGFQEVYNNELYFDGYDSTNGIALWKTDGTSQGTVMVKDIHQLNGWNDGGSFFMQDLNGKFVFFAVDTVYGAELWVSDGTSAGTNLLKDINPSGNSAPHTHFEINNKLLFSAEATTGLRELWQTDGTVNGTSKFLDFQSKFGLAEPSWLIKGFKKLGQRYVFMANNYLFITDGTASGTVLLSDTIGGKKPFAILSNSTYSAWDNPNNFFLELNGKLYFKGASSNTADGELWVTDGTPMGTYMVKDLLPGIEGSIRGPLAVLNSNLLFTASESNSTDPNFIGYELFISDGTAQGTYMLKELDSTLDGQGHPKPWTGASTFTEYNGKLYFHSRTGPVSPIGQIWFTDGTAQGTQLLHDSTMLLMERPLVYNNRMYFYGLSSAGDHLWQTEGDKLSTYIIKPMGDTNSSVDITFNRLQRSILNNKLLFTATYGDSNKELWALTTVPLKVLSYVKNNLDFTLYPNPASNSLKIETDEKLSSIDLYDIKGRRISSTKEKNIDVSHLVNGTYILKVHTEHGVGSSTFQVNR